MRHDVTSIEQGSPAIPAAGRALDRAGLPADCLQPRSADGRLIRPKLLLSAIACLLPVTAMAGPKGGQVVAGDASISNPRANKTVIKQSTDKSIIDWQSFSIGQKHHVKFRQPGKSSISLNRVVGGDPSSILGKLSSNGQVYLVNPNGIYFGQGAQVDVSGIVASVFDISNSDFLSANFVFENDTEAELGKVINDGVINARKQGYVVLMGDYVENNGVIEARMGKVVLASGSRVTMDISGNNLISVAVNEGTVAELAGVNNTGDIYADGGRVIMTAKVASDLIGSAVNNTGLVRANSIVEKDGAIFLTGIGGKVTNSGTLDASAVAGSRADGGGVLVYSDRDISLSSGAAVHARGDGNGAGGTVRVIAENQLDIQQGAEISVAGGPHNGGFVEVSGHGGLKLRGEVDVGSGGTLVIDPAIFSFRLGAGAPSGTASGNVGVDFVGGQLNAGNDVFVVASSSFFATTTMTISANSAGAGDLNIVVGTVAGGGGTLGGPTSAGQCNSAGVCLGGAGTSLINPDAQGSVNLGNLSFNLAGGLNVAGGTTGGTVTLGNINAQGNVTIDSAWIVNLQGGVNRAGSSFTVNAGSDILLNGDMGSTEGNYRATTNFNAGRDIVINKDIFSGNNDINLNADTNGNGDGDVVINGSTSERRTILTGGDLNVSGQDFNVNGADFGTVATSIDQRAPVTIKADRIMVTINGDMTLQAGRIDLDVNLGTSGAGGTNVTVDTSVTVSATSLVDITANNLNVRGGSAAAEVSGTFYTSSVRALANAELAATGGDMNVNLGGSLDLQAGTANAVLFDTSSSDFALAEANATMKASGAIDIVAANGVAVTAGTAQASAQGAVDSSGSPVTANANATLDADGNLDITIATGNLQVSGGTATARVTDSNGGTRTADASARAQVKSGNNARFAITSGSLSVQAGDATAEVSASSSNDASAVADANAELDVSGNLNIDSVGSNVTVRGGSAAARVLGSPTAGSTCSTCNARANANAKVQANNITFTSVGGNFDLVAGTAEANIGVGTYVESSALMRANANASMAANSVDITAGGTLNVSGGTARAGGSWTSGTVDIEAHADALLEATGNDLTLDVDSLNIDGGSAVIGSTAAVRGDEGTIQASALAEVIAARDVDITTVSGLAVRAGDAQVNFNTADDTISGISEADAKLLAGRNMDISVSGGNFLVQGGNAVAFASAAGTPRNAVAEAGAEALLEANGDLRVSLVSGDVNINGGSANANASGACTDCDADAKARARVLGGTVRFSNIGGDLNIAAGSANASADDGGAFCETCVVSANANAILDGGRVTIGSVTNLNVLAGNATALLSGNMSVGDARANANAELTANNNITANVTNMITVTGGSALVSGDWTSATTMSGEANANAIIDAGADLALSAVGGLSVTGGNANATPSTSSVTTGSPRGSPAARPTNGAASAFAIGELKAGGKAVVNVSSGSLTLTGGTANPTSGATGTGTGGVTVFMTYAHASVKAKTLKMTANTDITASNARINAKGVYLMARNNINLVNTLTTVGNGAAPGVKGDPLLFNVMNAAGIGLPNNTSPNLFMYAGNSMFTGDIRSTASNSYFWFKSNFLSTGNYSVPSGPLLVQLSPNMGKYSIGLEDISPSSQMVNYTNSQHISDHPMTTIAIGSAQQTGPIRVGANGPIDIGSKNIILLTRPDDVRDLSRIITTGIVATSGFVASVDVEPAVFVTPRLDNILVDLVDEEEEVKRRKRRKVEKTDNDHNMCVAL